MSGQAPRSVACFVVGVLTFVSGAHAQIHAPPQETDQRNPIDLDSSDAKTPLLISGPFTASGSYAPTPPADGLYRDALDRITAVEDRVVLMPVGVRLGDELTTYFDIAVVGDLDLSIRMNRQLLDLLSHDRDQGRRLIRALERPDGSPIQIEHWRDAMHRRSDGLMHFSMTRANGVFPAERSDEQPCWIITLTYERIDADLPATLFWTMTPPPIGFGNRLRLANPDGTSEDDRGDNPPSRHVVRVFAD